MVKLVCVNCNTEFTRSTARHNENLRKGTVAITCSRTCYSDFKRSQVEVKACLQCGAECSNKFCSRSCSSSYNNKLHPKRKSVKIPKEVVPRMSQATTTLAELRAKYSISQYHAKIRGLSRLAYKQAGGSLACENCGYDLHIDVCHIRDVGDFPMTATLAEVNHPDNLCGLDKRCHWEFDNGHLALSSFRK